LPNQPTLLKLDAALDRFAGEKAYEKIVPVLGKLKSALLSSASDLSTFRSALSRDFGGTLLEPASSQTLRPGRSVEAFRRRFSEKGSAGSSQFLSSLQRYFAPFEKLLVADFEVVGIDLQSSSGNLDEEGATCGAQVRYEFVGTGGDFHREQRVGECHINWKLESGAWRIASWHAGEEVLSRAHSPVFADVTERAFAANAAYHSQLAHGVDYWRTVLDGACGIDVYGHNGVAVGDFDGDGLDDIYVCQPAGLPNRLFRNKGDGTFEDVTEASGTGLLENTACALFADVNNDGRQHLIVVRSSGPILFLNDGTGKFRAKPDAFRFETAPQGTFTGAAIADYDRDGWLDIYFCLYLFYQGTEQYRYPTPYQDAENGPPNFLMRNNRDGTFSDVTAKSRLNQNNTRYSFCCGWNDYNQDGWPDLYVVNDFGRKNLYRNNGDGTFTDVADSAKVEDVGAGMSVAWCDFDNDGREDLYVADMWSAAGLRVSGEESFQASAPAGIKQQFRKHAMGNSLFHNNGDAAFADVSSKSGIGVGRWSWSSDGWDFDHDGFSDLYITNGMVSGLSEQDLNSFFWRQVVANSPTEAAPSPAYEQGWNSINELLRADGTWSGYERNVAYANNGDGTFSDVSGVVGLDFTEDGRAFALADFDRDGRLEVLLKSRNAPQLRLLKNVMRELPPSVSFRLRGVKSNRDAIGAVVTIQTDRGQQTKTVQAGSGFLSQHT
jgi:hypothetical protein